MSVRPEESYDYLIFIEDAVVKAKDGKTGLIATTGTAKVVLQWAINNLTSGGLIHIKRGNYTIDGDIILSNNGITIEGEGESTILKVKDNTNAIAFKIVQKQDISIRKLNIDGNKANQSQHSYLQDLILINKSTNIHLQNLHVHHGANKGILIQTGATYVTISDCIINDNYTEGVFLDTTTELVQFCTVTRNIIKSNGLAGVSATGTSHVISDNVIKQNGADGIYISGREIVIVGNNIDNNADCGIGGDSNKVSPFRGNVISGNLIVNNKNSGIQLENAQKTSITGNISHDNGYGKSGDAKFRCGIALLGNSYANEVTGNVCYNEQAPANQLYGVGTFDNADYTLVVGNCLRDNGSGPTNLTGSHNVVANNIQ